VAHLLGRTLCLKFAVLVELSLEHYKKKLKNSHWKANKILHKFCFYCKVKF
jgi:hypothetical protein